MSFSLHAQFNPADWYWVVAGDAAHVWSSARVQYVATSDATYQAWLAAGHAPTQIDSAASLVAVLFAQWLPIVAAQGVAVTSSSHPALTGTYAIDNDSLNNITAIAAGIASGKPLPGGGSSFAYPVGTAHVFDATTFPDFASAIEQYVYGFRDAVAKLVLGQSATVPTQPVPIP
jgi:hypothetical protein